MSELLPPPSGASPEDRRQWWIGLAYADLFSRGEDNDYQELTSQGEYLWELADRIEMTDCADPDEIDAATAALRRYCTALQNAPVDSEGRHVTARGLKPLQKARERLIAALGKEGVGS